MMGSDDSAKKARGQRKEGRECLEDLLRNLGIGQTNSGVSCGDGEGATGHSEIHSTNPATGAALPGVRAASPADYERVVECARAAFPSWRMVPPPRRGEVVRQVGEALRAKKAELGLLVTVETGKIRSEGEGEVQEMIDMCDFAVGLSRQLYGLTIASERPRHRMIEQWQPLGPIGIITAFNFPIAVWAWNAMIAAVCGDTMIWKPSPLRLFARSRCRRSSNKSPPPTDAKASSTSARRRGRYR